MTEGAIQN